MFVAAHRGFGALFPENTLVAFGAAFDLGADAVETDVRMTKDGVLILMHDETVDRTTNGSGRVNSLTFAQIEQLDACAKFSTEFQPCSVPTLRDLLRVARGRGKVILELKESLSMTQLASFLAAIADEDMQQEVLVISYDFPVLERLHRLDAAIPIGLVRVSLPSVDSLVQLGAAVALPEQHAFSGAVGGSRAYMAELASREIDVIPWTITNLSQGRALTLVGVRRFISDVPLDKVALTR